VKTVGGLPGQAERHGIRHCSEILCVCAAPLSADKPVDFLWRPIWVSGAGDVDGTEVFAIAFDAPNPGMTFIKRNLDLQVSLWHGKKDPSDPDWHDRNEVHTLLGVLGTEVRTVIDSVVAAVR
jgi:hypothetical protein